MTGQSIRRSQFITTYGPGAILEGPNGPQIIPALERSEIFTDDRPASHFEVADLRLSSALLEGASIVRIPSNAELGVAETKPVYKTIPFPSWALCTKHKVLYKKVPNVGKKSCPSCPPHDSEPAAWKRVRQQAIRFVRACPEGHLDDVDWISIVQHKRTPCQPSYLRWAGSGRALRQINIICPDCKGEINLGYAYSQKWSCSGRLPERGSDRPGCDAEARIIQRGAASLRIAELYSALTIPSADSRLYRLLKIDVLQQMLAKNSTIGSKEELLLKLRALESIGFLGRDIVAEFERFPEEEILVALDQMLPQNNRTLRRQEFDALRQATTRRREFEALRRAAKSGAFAQPTSPPGTLPQFEVIQDEVKEIVGPGGHHFRVAPVSRLRVVMVQTGYRRLDPLKSELIKVTYTDIAGRQWYPGVELFGEGIFIELAPSALDKGYHFPLQKSRIYNTWFAAWRDPESYQQRLQDPNDRIYLHPIFVWWHTLAHRLINALSIDSGYSSAALRERIYFDIEEKSGQAIGGILLYTVQPGGDGTLGGLIAQVPQFERVLRVALNTIDACSNDPLCEEHKFQAYKYNGSACYACQLVSETSCEHRNTRLDRTLLKENLP